MPPIWSSCAGLSGWIAFKKKTLKNKMRNRAYSEWVPATVVVVVVGIISKMMIILIIKRIQDDEGEDEVVMNIGDMVRSWF